MGMVSGKGTAKGPSADGWTAAIVRQYQTQWLRRRSSLLDGSTSVTKPHLTYCSVCKSVLPLLLTTLLLPLHMLLVSVPVIAVLLMAGGRWRVALKMPATYL